MDKLPIDIHLTRLVDWLFDRRNCPRDWQKNVTPIRNKINLAIQDMPENDEITKLLSGSTIHYFNCLKIVEILKETEKDSKNIFGMYSSQRMKDWNSVISYYQKNNIYLAEAASLLQRNVAYEIPALKKQISKCNHQQTEFDDKHISLGKSITEINIQIKQLCTELGIKGSHVSNELKSLPKKSTNIFDEIAAKCAKLSMAADFYTSYIEYFFERKPNESLPILNDLIKKGNITVYEWRTGLVPVQLERPAEIDYKFGDENDADHDDDGEINFDINEAIDFDVPDNNEEAEDIDWGDFDENTAATYDTNIEIDYDIDIDTLKTEICIEEAGVYVPTDNIAKGNDANNLLEWIDTRNLVLNDLAKLEVFLKQKSNEMRTESDNLLITTILQDAPTSIQSVTEKDFKNFIETIKEVQDYFKIKNVEKLLRINDTPKYLKRLYDQFVMKQKAIDRCNTNKTNLIDKQKEMALEEIELKKRLKLILEKTKELQKYVCEDLSKKYNGVRINLMGEINVL